MGKGQLKLSFLSAFQADHGTGRWQEGEEGNGGSRGAGDQRYRGGETGNTGSCQTPLSVAPSSSFLEAKTK